MVTKVSRFLALAAIIVVAMSPVCADVVTISPSNPGDWSWMANCHMDAARAYFTAGGPAPAEGNPFPTGNGAFYASLTWHGDDGETQTDSAWLGLDRHNNEDLAGVPLKNIKSLEYVVYNAGMYNWNMGGTNPRRHCKQPFLLSISAICQSTGDRRQFIYRPWGLVGWQHWNNRRAWLTLDAINMTSTPDFQIGNPNPPVWYDLWTGATFYSWAEIINTDPGGARPLYGDWLLVPTSTTFDPLNGEYKSPGWDGDTTPPGDPKATGTGKCVNLWVGARKWGTVTPFGNWVTESAGFKGYVDSFKLGVDYGTEESPNVVETTYDFASDNPPAREVAICDVGKSRWAIDAPYNFPYAKFNPIMGNQDLFNYRFFGQVIDTGVDTDTREFWFTIWDGSYAKISSALSVLESRATVTVRWPWNESPDAYSDPWSWPIQLEDWVSVKGYTYSRYYFQVRPPAEISASPANTVKYAPEEIPQ